MRIEDVKDFLQSKQIEGKAEATHISVVPAMSLKLGDDDDSREQLSKFVYEANRLKEPVALREVLTPAFALHFAIELKGDANDGHVKQVAAFIGKSLATFFPTFEDYTTVIYVAKLTEGVKGQVVFPDVVVDIDRARQVRAAIVESAVGTQMSIDLSRLHNENSMSTIIKEMDIKSGAEVPLAATTRVPVNTAEAAMNPLALAKISKQAVAPLSAPTDRWNWVMMGLKRRDRTTFRALTEWNPPRQFQKGAKGGGGSSGKSTGQGAAPSQPRSGYSQGGDKQGK